MLIQPGRASSVSMVMKYISGAKFGARLIRRTSPP